MSLTPDTLTEWATAAGIVGGTIYAAWKRGAAISDWCHDRWTAWRQATALRAKEQQEAERAIRVRDETIALLELRAAEWQRRYEDECREGDRKSAEIARLARRTEHLEVLLDGSRR